MLTLLCIGCEFDQVKQDCPSPSQKDEGPKVEKTLFIEKTSDLNVTFDPNGRTDIPLPANKAVLLSVDEKENTEIREYLFDTDQAKASQFLKEQMAQQGWVLWSSAPDDSPNNLCFKKGENGDEEYCQISLFQKHESPPVTLIYFFLYLIEVS